MAVHLISADDVFNGDLFLLSFRYFYCLFADGVLRGILDGIVPSPEKFPTYFLNKFN